MNNERASSRHGKRDNEQFAATVFEPCLNCARTLRRAAIIAELERLQIKFVHLDVSDADKHVHFAYSVKQVNAMLGELPFSAVIHLWSSKVDLDRIQPRHEDVLLVHARQFQALPDGVVAAVRRDKYGMGIVVDSPEQIEIAMLAMSRREIERVTILAIPLATRGHHPFPWAIQHLRQLAQLKRNSGSKCLVGIDGGVNRHTLRRIVELGVDSIVVGSILFGQPASLDKTRLNYERLKSSMSRGTKL